jgi:hypothetical protein
MGEDFAQIRLAPLLRVEALYLLGDISIGFVVCAKEEVTTRRPGIHAVERGAVVILTFMTPELEAALESEQSITYVAESIDDVTGAGWRAAVAGPAEVVADPVLRAHFQQVVPGFESGHGIRMVCLRPQSVDGHRFQRLSAAR